MKLVFDTNGNDKQKKVCEHWLNPEVSDIVYGGSKGSGKSYLGCSLIFGDAFLYPGTHYFIARKALNDLRKYTIPSIHEVFNHWGLSDKYYRYNGQDNFFLLHNGSKVFLIDANTIPSDPQFQRFGSMQMTRGWIEEAGEFEEAAKNGLAVSIGRWKNDEYKLSRKLLQTCNPAKNYLYYNYYQKNKSGDLEAFKRFVQALPQDNKKLPEGYLQHLKETLSYNEQQRLLYGNWEYDDDPSALIQYEKITDCFKNEYLRSENEYAERITIDVARFGSDKTVFGIWFNPNHVRLYKYKGLAINETAKQALRFQSLYSVSTSDIIADEDGVGGGVVDILGCNGFINNSRPLPNPITGEDENYNNLKSQCYYKLAEKINKGKLFIECDDPQMKSDIIQELEQVKQHNMDKDGKRQILPKDKVKEVIGRSPDYSDTLMMFEWFGLGKQYTWIAR